MNTLRTWFTRLALALTIASTPVFLGSASAEEEKKEYTELENEMSEISRSWRRVRRQVADPASNEDTAALVAKMKQGAEAALKLTPMRVDDVPQEERAAFLESYRTEMKKFVELLGKLELALRESRNAEAEELVTKIGAHQKSSHREYKRPE